ncbi:MAG: MATE family efflux transporter [Clostridia bacterium]|nr:MATE family efflux transporter [Clostridia bacterium]
MKIRNVDMNSPKVARSIILYAIPLVFINLVQSLFNSVDMVMLDAFDASEGSVAVAAVGATSSIIHFIVNTFFGISTGTKIVLSHNLGANHKIQIRRTVSTSIITAAVLGVVISVFGFFFSGSFLHITKCPTDCFEGAQLYLRIYMLGVPAIMLYNFASAIITTSGDTKRPLYYMIISGLTNVILNFILLMILPEKVMAVAIATAVSQCVGAALALFRLISSKDVCSLNLKNLKWSFHSFKKIMVNGLPIAFSSGLLPFSNLQIQTQLNELGSAVVAGSAAASNIESIVAAFGSTAMSSSVSVFVGYNIGAKRPDRVKKSILTCLCVGVGVSVVMSSICMIFSAPLASLFVTGEASVSAAQTRMFTNVLFYFIACSYSVLGHVIQSFGYSYISTINSIVSVLIFRIFWMYVIYPPHMDLSAPLESLFWIVVCWPVSWTLLLIANVSIFFYLYYAKFKKGKLKRLT